MKPLAEIVLGLVILAGILLLVSGAVSAATDIGAYTRPVQDPSGFMAGILLVCVGAGILGAIEQ